MPSYYSNAKLLLSGEYLVLEGAKALALPLKFGQNLVIEEFSGLSSQIEWNTYTQGKLWFQAVFALNQIDPVNNSNPETAKFLKRLLSNARELNSSFLASENSYKVKSNINFDINWGLGSSSSLISNVAYWADVDPYKLHFRVSDGSAYDIACARSTQPLLYQLKKQMPTVKNVNFRPAFHERIFFVYTGKKQRSDESIRKYRSRKKISSREIELASQLTMEFLKADNLKHFNDAIKEHEKLLSVILKVDTKKSKLFSDFEGEIKSLGAWGGDFIMVTWEGDKDQLFNYFSGKNLDVIFTFDEIILNNENK